MARSGGVSLPGRAARPSTDPRFTHRGDRERVMVHEWVPRLRVACGGLSRDRGTE